MIFNIVTYKRKASILPTALTVTGSWTNTQYVGSAMDTTGLTFTVTYNNGNTATVTPTTKSPATWTASGTQTATFTYTENGTTVSTTKTATVVAVALSSIAVSGSWTNTQYTDTAVDTTGLTVTATFNNGTTSNVTSSATVSPSTWSSTAGTQTATFSYTYNGVTKTASKTATVEQKAERKSVGGIIFYIDSSANGTYTFYNANGTQVSAPTVGTDCTGWTYEVTGARKDKYYVVYNELYTSKRWTYYRNGSYVQNTIGASGTAIGTGKTNTAIVMSADSGAYITSDSNGYPTVWYQIQQMRINALGGCDDWYVSSKDELNALYTSNAVDNATWFNSLVWTSSQVTFNGITTYYNKRWLNMAGSNLFRVCGIRSF